MRLVIDLQSTDQDWTSSLELARAVAKNRGSHDVFMLLNATSRERVCELRAAFDGLLSKDALRIWSAPNDHASWGPTDASTARAVSEHIRLGVLASLEPDALLLTGASSDVQEECARQFPFASDLPTAFLLQASSGAPVGADASRKQQEFLEFGAKYLNAPLHVFVLQSADQTILGALKALPHTFLPVRAGKNATEAESELDHAAEKILRWVEGVSVSHAPLTAIGSRPRLACISPLPPARSGIAEYTAQLLPELKKYYDIDLIANQDVVQDPRLDGAFEIRSVAWFEKNAGLFDRVLYHFGNSPFHDYMHDLLRKVPGIVVLHDFYLLDWKIGGQPTTSSDIVVRNHGFQALIDLENVNPHGWSVPANLDVLQAATGIIAHNEEPRRMARDWYGPDSTKNWHIVPLLRPSIEATEEDRAEARRKLGFAPNDIIICSFGQIARTKLAEVILSSFQKSKLAGQPNIRLIFVGELESSYTRAFEGRNTTSSGDTAEVTGWVDAEAYREYLLAADVAIQLREMSRGETSASVLDCLTHGIPTIVNAHGSLRELPSNSVIRIADPVVPSELTSALETLVEDADLRAKIGRNAQQEIGQHHAPDRCAELYHQAIEQSAGPMHQAIDQLPQRLSQLALAREDYPLVARTLAQNFPAYPRHCSVYVDVSAVARNDIHTGVQRVARAILKALLLDPDTSYQIVPVRIMPDGHFITAFSFGQKLLGLSLERVEDYKIDVRPGDVFLVLDLDFGQNTLRQRTYETFQNAGASIWHVVYDLLPVRFPDYFITDTSRRFAEWLNMVTAFDGAVCISKSTAEDLETWCSENGRGSTWPFEIRWFHLGADLDNSVPTRGLPDDTNDILQRLARHPTFLLVGTIEPRKGYTQTLDAFEQLWVNGVDVNLAIVGKRGWKMDHFFQRLEGHPEAGHRLFWFESISDEYLEKLYAASNCLIAASKGEGFGLPLIEAAQHKLPILARNLRVFQEVAGDHAAYFEGDEPEDLANAVRAWLEAWNAGTVKTSDAIPWLDWIQSAAQLRVALGLKDGAKPS